VVEGLSRYFAEQRKDRCDSYGHPRRVRQPVDGARLRDGVRVEHDAVIRANLQSVAEYTGGRFATSAIVHRIR